MPRKVHKDPDRNLVSVSFFLFPFYTGRALPPFFNRDLGGTGPIPVTINSNNLNITSRGS
jgi:hypothetical protein